MSENHESGERTFNTSMKRRHFIQSLGIATLGYGVGMNSVSASEASTTDIDSLVSSMSLKQKVSRTHGVGRTPEIAGRVTGLESPTVPQLDLINGPTGAALGDNTSTTAFPHPIALASTFNPSLAQEMGKAIARETKAGEADVLLGPSMDMFRVPFDSRNSETYGEDPYLSSEMAVAYTSSVQAENVIATPKHFVAYNQTRTTGDAYDESSISEHNSVVDERTLREIYLPPFRHAVQDGNAGALIAAYNRVNGVFSSENRNLLRDILKDEWGFDGFVLSDWGGTHSTVSAARNGLDVEMPRASYFGSSLQDAVDDTLDEAVVDEMVRRGLRSQREIGSLSGDREGVGDSSVIGNSDHITLAQEIAEEGTVLLKNEDNVLPIDVSNVSSIGVIGPTPTEFKPGVGGSETISNPIRRVGPVDGLDEATPDGVTVNGTQTDNLEYVPSDESGFEYEYYDNSDLEGDPIEAGTQATIDVEGSGFRQPAKFQSAKWTGTVTPSQTGTYGLSFLTGGQGKLYIDGELVMYREPARVGSQATPERSGIDLQSGTTYDVTVEITGSGPAKLQWNPPSNIQSAVDAASQNDVAVFIARTFTNIGADRYKFGLPMDQEAMIQAVADENDNTIVVLNTGSPVKMPWIDSIPAVLQPWFAGQEAGTALGNLLVGHSNPSGKTPVTFAQSSDEYLPQEISTLPEEARGYPGVSGDVYYDEGLYVGYRHFDEADIEPLFPFGYGESYTEFELSNIGVSADTIVADQGVTVSADVRNVGEIEGSETVQVYIADREAPIDRPPKELKGFAKQSVEAGSTETVTIELKADDFSYWDPDAGDWEVRQGEYEVMIGTSSRDIEDRISVTVESPEEDPSSVYRDDDGRVSFNEVLDSITKFNNEQPLPGHGPLSMNDILDIITAYNNDQ
ncbi:glycoside hydrolase family 3 C-terminal domain-containing protein [Haloarcula halophila]|uniref:glycoside hydrolase family 3 C-terminal domain-containing protein n=1 Tax=Haloarcula TaxID=2237 RepID=UPI0023E45525|nr:glycoside hydrolase family 3 C-terminal domain-containing protein [Halomicroarcula sp. DFY41]